MDIASIVTEILLAHGVLSEFRNAAVEKFLWSIEIRPAEGATAFSLPLIIAREGAIVRLAHYTISTYDVDFDPFVEFDVCEKTDTWRVKSIYQFHSGYRTILEEEEEKAMAFIAAWSETLKERGYADARQGQLIHHNMLAKAHL